MLELRCTVGSWLGIALLAALIPVLARAQDLNPGPYTLPSASSPSPYWGYSFDPYGGYLHGVADVTRAQGQWLKDVEDSRMHREKVRQEKLQTRRKELEHWVWEREFKNEYFERDRKRSLEREIEKSRTDPPLTEILAASSLNVLLTELKKLPNLPQNNSVLLEGAWLPHVHVTFVTTGTGGSMGLLKSDHLAWPLMLRRERYAAERQRFNRLMAQAKQEALQGVVTAETIVEGRQLIDRMERLVLWDIRAGNDEFWTPSDHIGALRALREFRSALQMLEREDAAVYLKPLKAGTVVELVEYMRTNGLSFSPATTGDERFYVALHRAMAQELTQAK